MRSERDKKPTTVAGFLQRLRRRWLARRLFTVSALTAAVSALAAPAPTELPTGGNVVGGSAAISQNAATMTVQQNTARAAIEWNTFNVGQDAQVRFVQPSASSVVLNRVLDSRPSEIFGNISANGQVFLVNPAGMYFSPTAQVDVGGLVATTHDIATGDFMAGSTTFRRNGASGAVINAGNLKAQLGGYIALLAPDVRNEGVIVAQLGTVALAAGETLTLNISGGRTLASITVTPSQIAALVENRNLVQAPGGLIIMSARAANALQGAVVNSGTVEATGMALRNGRIVLEASSRIDNSGTLRADAGSDGPAGSITLSAPDIVNTGFISATALATTTFQAGGLIAMQATTITQSASGVTDVGSSNGAGGRITIDAENAVAISGELRADARGDSTGAGGEIIIQAGGDVSLASAVVDASGADAGGDVRIEAGVPAPGPAPIPAAPATLALTGSTQLRVGSRRGSAGSATLTGDTVWLLDDTAIDATGATGGGLVQVGGSWQNSDTSVRQATNTYVGHDVVIDASATQNGDGGSIAVWSDIHDAASTTRAHGTLRAEGGASGGDGGRIETSGHWLDVANIRVSASAMKGLAGVWLLDPYDLYIANWTSGDAYAPPNFTPTTQTSSILASTIAAQLNANTNVTLSTGGTGVGGGDIFFAAALTGITGSATLTANAGLNNVYVQAPISASGALNLVFTGAEVQVAQAITTAGSLTINNSGQFTTAWGLNLTANGGFAQTGAGLSSLGGNITTSGTALSFVGDLLLRNNVTLSSGGGNISIGGNVTSTATAVQSFTATGAGNFSAATGSVEVLVVGGGGGGAGGGGGGGGVLYDANYTVTGVTGVSVGAGGASYTGQNDYGDNGGASGFGSLSALGGGGGSSRDASNTGSCAVNAGGPCLHAPAGLAGGSGGGASASDDRDQTTNIGGAGTLGQGNSGGKGFSGIGDVNGAYASGGGGGAGTAGTAGTLTQSGTGSAGHGGDGLAFSISGSSSWYGGGGGGSGWFNGLPGGNGGLGGGGAGGGFPGGVQVFGQNGSANTGGGGGGTQFAPNASLGIGGSGVVIVRYQTTGTSTLTINAGTGNFTQAAGKTMTNMGAVSISANDVALNGSIAVAAPGAALQVSARNNILLAASQSLTTQGGSITLGSDSDTSGAGGIQIGSGASVSSNNGNVVIGGGAAPLTGYAVGSAATGNAGVNVQGSINTGTGSLTLHGRSAVGDGVLVGGSGLLTGNGGMLIDGISSYTNNSINTGGVRFTGSGVRLSTGSGNVTIVGNTPAAFVGPGNNTMGLLIDAGAIVETTGAGTLSLTGTNDHGGAAGWGAALLNGTLRSTAAGGGAITVTGNSVDWPLVLFGTSQITTNGAAINLTSQQTNFTNGVFLSDTSVVNAGSGNINIVTNNLSLNTSGSLQGTGTLTVGTYTAGASIGIAGAAGNMALAASYFSNNFGNGFSSITIGGATTGAIASNGFSFRDNLTLWAGSANASVTLAGAIANAGTGTSSGSLTVKAAGDINANGTITTQAQAVVLNSDSDAASGGAIRLGNNAGINSNGGAVTLGGGSNATGFATAQAATPNYGIEVGTGVNLLSGGGDLTLRGMSHASNFSGVSMGLGFWSGATTTLDAGSGKLSITGVSQGIGSPNSQGMAIPSTVTLSSTSSAADAITLSGSYTGTGTSYGIGLNIGANVIASNGGGITLNGAGGAGAAGASWGIYMAANLLANSGPITLNGIGGNGSADIYSVGNNFIGYRAGSAVTASSSDITINANTLTLLGTDRFQSSGDLVIAPRMAGTTIGIGGAAGTLQLASSYFSTNFVDGFSSITVGSSSAGQLNIAGATTYNDALVFKSASDVLLAGGASLTGGVGQNAALTFHADADASGAGGILINAGSSITTNNGDLVLGGGLNPLTGYAQATAASQGSGIQMLGNINAGTGNVTLNGRSALGNGIFFNTGLLTGNGLININGISSYTTNADYVGGVRFFGAGTRLSTATGTVTINGNTPVSFVGPGNNTMGVLVNGGAVVETTGSGTLTFNATNDHGGSAGWGIGIWDGTVRSTGAGGGAITITANSLDWPLVLMGTGQVTSNGGDINLVSQQTNYTNGVFLDNTAVVNAGSGAINITANNLTLNASGSLQGTGALNFNPFTAGASIGIGGAAGNIQLAATYFSNNFANGFSGITIGGATTGAIAANGFTFRDNLTLWAGSANSNVTLAGTIANAGTGTSSGSLTVKAAGDIASTAAITTQNQAVVFDSDSDGSGVGAIALYSGASIASNGGAITLAGGLDPATGSAMGSVTNVNGIYADSTVALNSGGGNILMRGMSDTGATGAVYSGVYSESSINSGSGTITIDGVSRGTGAANKRGVSIYGTITSANTTANAITITGSNANANASWSAGIQSNATITATNGGGITLTGTGGTTSAGGNSAAGLSFTSTSILANGGPITLNGIAGTGSTDLRSWDGNTIGYKAATAVTSSTSNITLNLDTLTLQSGDRLQSSGTLTIAPRTAGTTVGIGGAAGTLQLAASYFATNFGNGFSSVVIGSATTGNLASNGFTFADNLTLWAGNANATATLSGAIANAGTGTSSGTLTVKAAGDIATSAAITTQAQAVLLNSNSDAAGTGAIRLLAGSSISSNGGAITLGGGTNGSGYAVSGSSTQGNGIDFGGSVSLLSAGGDITLRGQSYTGQVTAGYAMGIVMQYGNDTINAGTGKISLTGISTGNGSSNSQGIALNPGSTLISSSTAADAITLTGSYTGSGTTSYGLGTNFQGTALAGNGGGIVFTGTGGNGGAGISMGVYLGGAVLANTGAITLTGTAGNGSSPDIYMTGGATLGYKAATAITASSSNITLNANSVTIQAGDRLQSSGALVIAPRTAGTTVGIGGAAGTLQLASSYFATNFVNGFSSITVGSTGAGDIALSGATTYNDALTLKSAGNIVMNASASLTGGVGQNAALTFNADADANSSGGIQIGSGASITSNNGNVVLGGGATPATGYAWGTATTGNAGINVLGNITTGSGNLTLNGRSGLGDGIALAGGTVSGNGTLTLSGITTYTGNSGAMSGGVAFRNSGTRLSTATGTVVVNGSMPGATTGTGSYAAGILIDGGAVVETTGSGTLTFTGTQSSAATPWNLGIGIRAGTVRSTAAGGGAISFTGSSVGDTGVLMRADAGAVNVTSNGGDITITSTTSAYTGFEFGGTFGATVSAGSGNITVRADKANFNANSNFVGTGTITIAPYTTGGTVGINGAAGTLQVSAAVLSSYIANGFNSVVIGSNTTGNLASNGFSFRDNLTLWAGNPNANVTLAGAIANVGTGTSSGSLTVKAAGNISSSAAITTQAQAIILNSDSDGSGAGAIAAGGSISSNGGAITLGGGNGVITAGSGFARGHAGNIVGISITGAIAAGGGDIVINGAGDAVTNGVSRPIGVAVQGGGSVSTTGSGDITITGQAMNSGPSSLEAWGISIGVPSAGAGTVSVADGDLVLNGTGSGITNAIGTLVYTGTVQATGSGTVSVYGTAGNGVANSGYTRGVDIESAGIVRTNSGALLLDGNNTSAVGTTGTAHGVHINGQSAGDSRVESVSGDITIIGARLAGIGVDVMVNNAVTANLIGNGTSGDITVLANTVDFSGARFSGTGTLTIAPRTAGTTVGIGGAAGTLQLAGSYFATNFVNGFGSITVGGSNAGTLSASGATTYYDALTFKSADDVLLYSASLTGAAGQLADLTLHADADASGAGGILVDGGSSITTNDGALVMGGGAVALTGYAQATGATQNSGIQMLGNVTAGTGAVTLNGQSDIGSGIFFNTGLLTGNGLITINGITTFTFDADYIAGVRFFGAGTRLSTTTGTVIVNGNTPAIVTGTGNNAMGVMVSNGAVVETTGSGTLTLNGSNDHGGNWGWGVGLYDGTVRSTAVGGGAININGISLDWDVVLFGTSQVTSNGGAVNITAQSPDYWNGFAVTDAAVVNAGSGALTVTANSMTLSTTGQLQGTGALAIRNYSAGASIGIAGAAGDVQIAGSYFGSNIADGFSSITVGGETTGNIASNGFTFRDDLTLWAGVANSDVTLAGAIANAGTGTASGALTVKAAGNINSSAVITTQNQAVIFNSNSDAVGSGAISVLGGSIASNGGDIVLGGGLDPVTGYAIGNASLAHGIRFDAASTLSSAGGNISLLGAGQTGVASDYWGIYADGTIDSGAGTIVIDGTSQGIGSAHTIAVSLGGTVSSTSTSATAITVTGLVSPGGNTNTSIGVNLYGTIQATNGGGIAISGTSGLTTAGAYGEGIYMGNASVLANAGPITLTAIAPTVGITDITMAGNVYIGQKAGSAVTASTSDITLNVNDITITAGNFLQSGGDLDIAPRTAGTTIGIGGGAGSLQIASSHFSSTFVNGFTSITVGNATAGNLTVGGAIAGSDSLALVTGGAIALNAPITLGGSDTLTLTAATTAGGNGNLVTGNLLLNGAAAYSLASATANNIGTLAATGIASLDFRDSNALTLGTVAGVNGVSATGAISIVTASGDLTVAQGIATTDTGSSAIVLNAGQSAAAGTATGGDIIISAALTTGAGGRALLYTGSIAGSTGVAAAAGAGHYRYNSDEVATNFAAALGSDGVWAIYREQPTVTVTATDDGKTYDGVAYSGGNGVSYGGFANGEDETVLTGTLAYGGDAQGAINAGSYAIGVSGLGNDLGYALSFVDGALTIGARAVTVTADAGQTKTYGAADAVFGYTLTDGTLVSGDAFGGALARATGEDVGTYAIGQGSLDLGTNYTLTYVGDDFAITPATLTITASNAAKTYGQTVTFAGTEFSSIGLQNGETIGSVSLVSAGSAATASVAGGPYAIVASAAVGGSFDIANYSVTYVDGTLTVGKAALAVTAADAAKTYGQTVTFTGSEFASTGLQNGETIGSVSLVSAGAAATAGVAAGPYSIVASNAVGGSFDIGNYDVTYVDGTLTVGKALLTINASNASKTYGQTVTFAGTEFTSAGLQNSETIGSVGLTSAGAGATANVAGGPYAIVASSAVGGSFDIANYDVTYVDGALSVGKATLTVTADNAAKIYGETETFAGTEFTSTGLQNGEAIGSVTLASAGAAATASVAGSPYTITIAAASGGTFDLANYDVTYVDGVLAVARAALTVTADNAAKTYGQTVNFAGTEFSSTGLQNGESIGSVILVSAGSAATAGVAAGPYAIAVSGAAGGSFDIANYDVTYLDGVLTVGKAGLTVTADSTAKTYGQLVTFAGTEFTSTGLQNGETVGSVSLASAGAAATAGVAAGPYAIVASAAGGGSFDIANYDVTYVDGTLTVGKAGLTVTADNAAKIYGQTVTFAGTEFTSTGLQNGEAIGSVTLASTGAAATAGVAAGPYAIGVSDAVGGSFDIANYDITYVDGTLAVNQAALTITASDAAKIYGQTLAFNGSEFTSVGLQNGEAIGSVTLVSDGAAATAAVGDGSHDILVSDATGGTFDIANYSVTYVAGELLVDRAALTITADNAAKLYGQTVTFGGSEFSSVGLQNGETIGSVSLSSAGAVATAGVAAGPYAIVASGAAGGSFDIANYDVTYDDGTLTVSKTTLTVTAVALSRNFTGAAFYGGGGVTYSGFVNGEDRTVLGGTLGYAGGSQGAIAPATYVLTPQGLTSDNYTLVYVDSTLTILPGLRLVPPPVVVSPPIVIAPSTSFGTPSLGYGSSSSTGTTTSGATTSTSGTATSDTTVSGTTGSTASTPGTLGSTGGTTPIGATTSTQPGLIAIPAISADTGPIATAATVAAAAATATSSGAGATAPGTGASSGGSTTTASSGAAASGTGSSTGSTTTSTSATAGTTPATGTTTTGSSSASTSTAATGSGTSATSGTSSGSTSGTGTTSGTSTSGSTTAAAGTGSTAASGSGTGIATSGTATTPLVTGDATSVATTPATVATVSTSIAGADAPATALESFSSSRVEAAMAAGMPATQAQQAGTAYTETLTQLLAQGVPMSEAVTRAEQIFQAEAAFPAVTPQQAMGASLATGGDALVSQINSLSGAQSGAGTAAFDVVLANALAEGVSFAEAVSTAQVAARVADSLARADATPQSMLASGNPEAAAAAFASTSADYQQALSEALAQGVPLEQAMARADAVAQSAAAGAAADARSPAVALASGNPGALPQGVMKSGTYDRALQSALARGLSLEEAMAQAAKADAWEQQVAVAEARNVAYGFSSGSMLLPVADAAFDQALTNAIARGVPPAEALAIARAAAAKSAAVTPSATTALASGSSNEVLLFLVGSSRTFRMTLSNALARGLSVEKAIELAKRAEAANAFRFRLPPEIARQLPTRGTVTVITANGKPLPAWLAFSLRLREFVAVEVPEGGLPVPVVIRAGTQRFAITVSEGPAPQQQPRALARRPVFTPVKK